MAGIKNTMKVVKSTIGKLNPYYDMSYNNIMDICKNSTNTFDIISNAFRFGYAQGMKAAKAEAKARVFSGGVK